jgi:soluble P-type ATPase
MFNAAALRIAVLGPEGMATALLSQSDILVRDINDALDLLLYPQRLAATLRR